MGELIKFKNTFHIINMSTLIDDGPKFENKENDTEIAPLSPVRKDLSRVFECIADENQPLKTALTNARIKFE